MAGPVLPSIYKSITAPKGANPQDVQSAQDQMALTYAPQEMGINTAIHQIDDYLKRDISAQQQYGQIADQKIAQIGSELANTLQGNTGKVQDIYGKGVQQVGSAYDEALQTLQNVGSSVQGDLTQSAAQLGQSHALAPNQFGRDPLSRLKGDLAVYTSRTAAGKATATTNLATLGTQLAGIAQKAVGDSEREYAQKRTDIASQVLKTIGELQTTANFGIQEQLNKFSVLAETAGPAFRQLLSQATAGRTEAERQQAKDTFDQMMKVAGHNLDVQKFEADNDPSSLSNQLKQADLATKLKGLEKPKYIGQAEGEQNLMSFLNSAVRKDRKSEGISGTAHAGIQNFIRQNMPGTQLSGVYNTEDPVALLTAIAYQSVDPKTKKVNLPVSQGSKYKQQDYQVDLQTLLDAINVRFANVGDASKYGTEI